MSVGVVVGLVLMPFVFLLMAAANKQHREEHGVDAPSRKAMTRIRRNARQKGITNEAAHAEWVSNKRKRTRKPR